VRLFPPIDAQCPEYNECERELRKYPTRKSYNKHTDVSIGKFEIVPAL